MASNLGDTLSSGWTVTGGPNDFHIHYTTHQLGQNLISTVSCEPTITCGNKWCCCLAWLGADIWSNPAVIVIVIYTNVSRYGKSRLCLSN